MSQSQPTGDVQKAVFSPAEAAQYLGCSRSHVYELMFADALPSIHLGRSRKIRRTDLERLIEEGTGG